MKNYIMTVSLCYASSFLLLSCASVPKDAPLEAHEAKAELDKAGKMDTEDYFPYTIKESKKSLAQSVKSFEKYKNSESMDMGDLEKSKAYARQAKNLALGANELKSNIKEWDKNNLEPLEGHYSILALNQQIKELQEREDRLTKEKQAAQKQLQEKSNAMATSQFAKLTDFRVSGPSAFFDSGSDHVPSEYRSSIEELARTLKANNNLKVTVAGYADKRGSEDVNNRISKERADQIAALLKANGIENSRITIEAYGKKFATNTNSPAKMQRDRRADVILHAQ